MGRMRGFDRLLNKVRYRQSQAKGNGHVIQ